VPVHHVHVNPIGAGLFDRRDFLAKTGEVRRQNTGGYKKITR
jgi:hypothetical protein